MERGDDAGLGTQNCGSASKVQRVSRTACNSREVITDTFASHSGLRAWGSVKMI
jgi:hypothetical protein